MMHRESSRLCFFHKSYACSIVLLIFLFAGKGRTFGQGIEDIVHKPHLSVGGGILSFEEDDSRSLDAFDLRIDSDYQEPLIATGIGWEAILNGYHGLSFDFDFLQAFQGTQETKTVYSEPGSIDTFNQENDLDIRRYSFSLGYLYSSWDRARPPERLRGNDRTFRFAGGFNLVYWLQHFTREGFSLIDSGMEIPQATPKLESYYHLAGAELVAEVEVGPRELIAGFLRGKVGGGYVRFEKDICERAGVDQIKLEQDFDTAGIYGTIEAGIVSQILGPVELRMGYRYNHLFVFGQEDGEDILPDSTTVIHMGFLEAALSF